MDHLEFGRRGEELAARFLRSQGARVLARNYRWSRAEVDLILQLGSRMHFVEVKTRTWQDVQAASDAVSRKKQGLLIGAAGRYMEDADYDGDFQFDILVVILDAGGNHQITWMQDAFGFDN